MLPFQLPLPRKACRSGWLAFVMAVMMTLAQAQQQDRTAERNLRRLQLQMQGLQQQLDEAQAARTRLDADKSAAEKELARQQSEIPRAQGALRKKDDELKASEAARAELATRLAALEKELAERKRSGDESLAARDKAMAAAAAQFEQQRAEQAGRETAQGRELAECSDKNQRLARLGAELLERYRRKGVAEALKQREPVFGFGDVEMFNVVQEARDRIEAERHVPAAQADKP